MNPVLLQKQLKDNAADLDEFYKDLRNWGENMKHKEELHGKFADNSTSDKTEKACSNEMEVEPKSIRKKVNLKNLDSAQTTQKHKTTIGLTNYAAWEKFDADAECEKIDRDENEDSDLTDEHDDTVRDQAYLEKEKGNKFVKNEKWDEAIECYTKAIDCYAYDPIFYANRALCFLKKANFAKAEVDCSLSLKLDLTYVKAYQRRASAKEALGNLEDAERDLLKVLEFEPKNKETLKKLEILRNKLKLTSKVPATPQRPVSKFTTSRQHKNNIVQANNKINTALNNRSEEIEKEKNPRIHPKSWSMGNDVIIVKAVNKPVHLQSKQPLKRIKVQEVVGFEELKDSSSFPNQRSVESLPQVNLQQQTLKTDDLKIIEKTWNSAQDTKDALKETKNQPSCSKIKEEVDFSTPTNSVQFYTKWKFLKMLDEKYAYMKLIEPEKLPDIFKESLDSSVLSEMLEVFAKCFTKCNDKVFHYLFFFTQMKRFSAFTLFLSDADKIYLRQLFDYIKQHEDHPEEDVNKLLNKYEL